MTGDRVSPPAAQHPAAASEGPSAGADELAPYAPAARLLTIVDWLPAAVVAFAAVVSIGAAQGGYFPTSWGPAIVAASAVVLLWVGLGARTDAGWRDAALVGLLALFAVWTGLSTIWSGAPALSILELQRVLVLLLGVSAVLALASRGGETHLAYAVMAGIAAVAGYSLATRLAPDRIGDFDPTDGYRLSSGIGYWNGLGTFAAMGIVLAIGIAVGARAHWQRITASVALVVLVPTLYFTFSRGASVALACGIGAMFVITPHRLRTLGALAILAPAPAIALLAASHFRGLTNQTTTLSAAAADGRTMTWILIGLAGLAAGAAVLLIFAETRLDLPARARRVIGASTLVVLVVAILAVVVRAGGPSELSDRALRGFDHPPQSSEQNLNEHLFTLSGSGRVDLWRVAWSSYREHPAVGIGAGSFERYWQKDERATFKARDVHSLYLETLTELGPPGLILLLAIGAVIVGSAVSARRSPVVPAALGAFAVYAVHAGVEWDWELTGVTLTAFFAGITGLIALRRPVASSLRGPLRIGLGVAVAGVAIVAALGYIGNKALSNGQKALDANDPTNALADVEIARRWIPWSPYPLTIRGEALLGLGDVQGANAAFEKAIDVDPGYWRAWLGLAVASTGDDRKLALEHASSLYVNSEEIYRTVLLLRRADTRKLE